MTDIGGLAFYGCSSLTSVAIPNSVKSIEWKTFYGCSSLTSVTIGNGVMSIGEQAFYGCSSLKKVIVSDVAAWCGVKFAGYGDNPLRYAHHLYSDENTEIKHLVIPNSVTSIGDNAFDMCSGLTSVTIPNSVTSIGDNAFEMCSGITSVTIPNSVASIGNNAFYRCSGLTSVTIPNSVASIGNNAFEMCSGITSVTIGNSVKSIGGYAFKGCSGLTSITIPNSVKSIKQYAFWGCSGLQKVIVSDIAAWCDIEFGDLMANPLYYAHHLYSDENTEIRNLIVPNSVKSIGRDAFRSCSGLTSVTIGNSVTNIGEYAFINCTALTSVIIGNSVTSIDHAAFSGCSSLASVFLGSGVTSIGEAAFNVCKNLTTVNIPNRVTSIGDDAFSGCSSLTSIKIPVGVSSIGGKAFYGCSGLTKAEFASIESLCNISFGDSWSNPLRSAKHLYIDGQEVIDLVIPESVTSIGDYAFQNCSGLNSVTIPNCVMSIGRSAFDEADIPTIISLIENPFTTYGKTSNNRTFSLNTFNNATLYVPTGTIERYKTTEGWKDFVFIEEGDPTGINVVENTKNNNTIIYDLNGVRLSNIKKGINIINGKKVLVK